VYPKYTDISATFSIVKPLFEGFSSNLSIVISGYGGLRTFMQTDPNFPRAAPQKSPRRPQGQAALHTARAGHSWRHCYAKMEKRMSLFDHAALVDFPSDLRAVLVRYQGPNPTFVLPGAISMRGDSQHAPRRLPRHLLRH
jgi:hypothetical protein